MSLNVSSIFRHIKMSESSECPSFSKIGRIDEKFKLPVLAESRVKYPSIEEMIFHRRHGPRTRYYTTSGHEHLGEANKPDGEESAFVSPPQSHMFAYHRRSVKSGKISAKKARVAHEERAKDILRRLRVDVEAEKEEAEKRKDSSKATAATDLDPNYFTQSIGCGSVLDRFSKRRYIDDARQTLRTRLLAGQERDDCIRIDQQFAEERRRLDETKENYRTCVNSFEEFLSRDHEESMAVLGDAESQVKRTYAVRTERNILSREIGQSRLEVYALEESWRFVKTCQKFIYRVSPISWRLEHDWIHRRSSSGSSILSADVDDLLGQYKSIDGSVSLESLIEMFEAEVAEAPKPLLYFQHPSELTRVLRSMELQNLNALMHLESLAGPMAEMAASVTETEALIKRETSEIEEGLADIEQERIGVAEARATSLERYADNLLGGVFRRLVCSEPVLNLRVFVEDTYESCLDGPNDANLDTYTMMHLIEKTYERLNTELDDLPPEIVRVCEKEGFEQELAEMRDAEDAARKFELMHRLLAALERIMEAPKSNGTTKRRSASRRVLVESKAKVDSPPGLDEQQPLGDDDDEIILLRLFTDYQPRLDDPRAFRHRIPDDFRPRLESGDVAAEANGKSPASHRRRQPSGGIKFCTDDLQ